jgi:hypothetical protein
MATRQIRTAKRRFHVGTGMETPASTFPLQVKEEFVSLSRPLCRAVLLCARYESGCLQSSILVLWPFDVSHLAQGNLNAISVCFG